MSNCLEAQRHSINCHEYARYPRVLSFYEPLAQANPSLVSSATLDRPLVEPVLRSLYLVSAQEQALEITDFTPRFTSHVPV